MLHQDKPNSFPLLSFFIRGITHFSWNFKPLSRWHIKEHSFLKIPRLLWGSNGKEYLQCRRPCFNPWEKPSGEGIATTPGFLPENSLDKGVWRMDRSIGSQRADNDWVTKYIDFNLVVFCEFSRINKHQYRIEMLGSTELWKI